MKNGAFRWVANAQSEPPTVKRIISLLKRFQKKPPAEGGFFLFNKTGRDWHMTRPSGFYGWLASQTFVSYLARGCSKMASTADLGDERSYIPDERKILCLVFCDKATVTVCKNKRIGRHLAQIFSAKALLPDFSSKRNRCKSSTDIPLTEGVFCVSYSVQSTAFNKCLS